MGFREDVIHQTGSLQFHGAELVSVHVQRGRRLRVPQDVGDGQKRNAVVEHDRCRDVTQIVKPDMFQVGRLLDRCILFEHVALIHRRARAGWEDKIVLLPPFLRQYLLYIHFLLLKFQHFDRFFSYQDHAVASDGLRCAKIAYLFPIPKDALQITLDMNLLGFPANVLPLESEQLSLPHTSLDRQVDQRPQRGFHRLGDQLDTLFFIQRVINAVQSLFLGSFGTIAGVIL